MKFRTWPKPPPDCEHGKFVASGDPLRHLSYIVCGFCGEKLVEVTYSELMKKGHTIVDEKLAAALRPKGRRVWRRD